MTRLEFFGSLTKRASWWIWTGATIGAYCGIVVGAIHGFVLVSLAFLFELAITLFTRASVLAINSLADVWTWLPIIALGAFVGGVIGAFAGA